MTLDDATAAYVRRAREAGTPPLHLLGVEGARQLGRRARDVIGPGPDVAAIEDHDVLSADGGRFPVRVLRPPLPRGVIVYAHGGGWTMGGIEESDALARHVCADTMCTVVVVGYRLAPEHPHPAALDDVQAALAWAAEHATGEDALPLVLLGDSAGGNLVAALTLRAREVGGPVIALQVLVCPVTDADFERASYVDPDNQLLLTREAMMWFWKLYAPETGARGGADAAPLRAADLAALPPAIVYTAEHDVLRDEGEAYAERLIGAGVPVTLQRCIGQTHGFFGMVRLLPGSIRYREQLCADIVRHLDSASDNRSIG